jgi:uncharacterized protein
MEFEWDPVKAEANRRKHGVSFQEAVSVFNDPMAITFVDPDHSDEEQRFVTIGYGASGKLLVVYHADRKGVARLIGARVGTRRERKRHESEE